MKKANIVELKNKFSKILMYVEKGERIQVCKRNIPEENWDMLKE